ncbi:prospero homeobox protein 1-like [Oncorhynchus tshawytscha]|uniref:Prospero domain-containing protein n=1 Tax=Oncorhynchus tshawytscha TaxID=74940 RepID=A0A8C8IE19_ONCTS|nr:prospero homeobox protein 1-like [Oncorhynchus tshawytscha]XP_042181095.1 prospero homeobox protein 1-like [Oncorhynchus tshawytscha]
MPDHDSSALSRQTKRRRVDIGVKRTVGSVVYAQRTRETILFNTMNQSHGPEQDRDCSLVPHSHGGSNGDGEKSNVLRKLLKRANSYEDAMMPYPGTTIISQLLKSNMGKNGDREGGFQGSGGLSSAGSDFQAEDVCSNSSRDRDSPLAPSPAPSSPLPPPLRPPPSPHTSLTPLDLERLTDEHLRAKRARVENIIRGMSHSPCVPPPALHPRERDRDREKGNKTGRREDRERERNCPPLQPPSPGSLSRGGEGYRESRGEARGEVYRENKRKQRLPQQQQQSFTQLVCVRQEKRQEERRQLKLQLEDMQKQLRQLQEKFYQIYETETEEEEEEEEERAGGGEEDGNLSENSVRSDGLENTHRDRRGNRNRADGIYDDLSELVDDPGLFLDRARALLREQALLAGEKDEEGEKEEGERDEGEREGGRRLKRDWGQGERGAGGGPMRAEGRQLAETLKQELNSAMSQVVDTVVKGFNHKPPSHHHLQHHPSHHSGSQNTPSATKAPSQASFPPFPPSLSTDSRFGGVSMNMNGDSPNFHSANQRLPCFGDVIIPSTLDSFGGLSVPTAGDQTEALPLVVRKTSAEQHQQNPCLPPPPPPHPHHPSLHSSPLSASLGFSPPSFRHPFPLPLMGYPFQSFSKDQRSSPESMDLSRETVGLRTKMGSGGGVHFVSHHHHHRQSSPPQHGGGSEGLSLIKSECGDLQDMADISPYSGGTIQEGLSPNHLKKAKLMFFYSRYPSSNMLKTFFSDVKFNRCITSQLIKWFSNFREFYYIQMEKFARQAINEGVTTNEDLSVGRESELYRALNMHYNKANDFEVPERFLEVSQLTLREFFNAIVAGKDVDPSWKKAIYKVICKLDSEVPEVFKSPNCLQELLNE